MRGFWWMVVVCLFAGCGDSGFTQQNVWSKQWQMVSTADPEVVAAAEAAVVALMRERVQQSADMRPLHFLWVETARKNPDSPVFFLNVIYQNGTTRARDSGEEVRVGYVMDVVVRRTSGGAYETLLMSHIKTMKLITDQELSRHAGRRR